MFLIQMSVQPQQQQRSTDMCARLTPGKMFTLCGHDERLEETLLICGRRFAATGRLEQSTLTGQSTEL